MHYITYDDDVYSDAELTTVATGPFSVGSTTDLAKGIYYAAKEYVGTGKQKLSNGDAGDDLWTARFTYPDDVDGMEVSILSGAVFDE